MKKPPNTSTVWLPNKLPDHMNWVRDTHCHDAYLDCGASIWMKNYYKGHKSVAPLTNVANFLVLHIPNEDENESGQTIEVPLTRDDCFHIGMAMLRNYESSSAWGNMEEEEV